MRLMPFLTKHARRCFPKRRWLAVVGLGILIQSMLTPSTPGRSQDFSSLFERVAPAVVLVDTELVIGSGFIVDDFGLVVTACHVVDFGLARLELGDRLLRVVRIFVQGDPRTYLATVQNDCRFLDSEERVDHLPNAMRDDVAILDVIGYLDEAESFFPLSSPTGLNRLWLSKDDPKLLEPVFLTAYGGDFSEFSITAGTLAGELNLFTLSNDQPFVGLDFSWRVTVLTQEPTAPLFAVGLGVVDLVENGASAQAGIGIGDLITMIDGQPLQPATLQQRLDALEEGQSIRLTVLQPDGGRFETPLTIGRYVRRSVWTPDTLWCFKAPLKTLSRADFNRASRLDLTFSRTSLSQVLAMAKRCAMVLVGVFGVNQNNASIFDWIGIATAIEGQSLLLERISNTRLTPFQGEVVPLGDSARLDAKHFFKITSIADFGSSGGPVLNSSGQVIGIMNFGPQAPVPAYIIGSGLIRDHLNGLEHQKKTDPP